MPRFHFNLSSADQCILDTTGCELDDLVAAHSRAVQIADRVMMFSAFADRWPNWRRWTVQVTDCGHRSVINVIFPADFVLEKRKPIPASGARGLLRRVEEGLRN